MANFYNPNTKEIISITELSKKYNVSIPEGLDEIKGYYKIYQGTYPEHNINDSVILDKIRKKNGKYYQSYKVVQEDINAKKERFKEIVKKHLNETANEKDYDSIENACSYVNSTNPIFSEDAQKAIIFRDNTWNIAYEMLNSDNFSELSETDFISMLPNLDWNE